MSCNGINKQNECVCVCAYACVRVCPELASYGKQASCWLLHGCTCSPDCGGMMGADGGEAMRSW